MTETFYDVLGVPEDANEEAITDAYRERVKEVHPDVSDRDDAAEQFKLVSKAEEVLTDEAKRQRYDRLGHETYMAREEAGVNDNDTVGPDADTGPSPGANGFDNIRDAAAWARENTGRSGPTNRGADAGWRRREKERYDADSSDWNIDGEGSWNIDDGDGGEGWGFGDDNWEFGGDGWEIGDDWKTDSDWDLGANWDSDDERSDRHSSSGAESDAGQDAASGSDPGNRDDPGWSTDRRTDPGRARETGAEGFGPTWDSGSARAGDDAGSAAGAGSDIGFGASSANRGSQGSSTGFGSIAGKASTDGGGAAAANHTFDAPDPDVQSTDEHWSTEQDGYTVKEWDEQPDPSTDTLTWLEPEYNNFGLLLGTFFMLPILLVTSVLPAFPLPFNVIIGICTLLVTGYLITRPQLGIMVFAPWAAVFPLGLWLVGFDFGSPIFLSALIGTWIPLAYAVVIAISLNE